MNGRYVHIGPGGWQRDTTMTWKMRVTSILKRETVIDTETKKNDSQAHLKSFSTGINFRTANIATDSLPIYSTRR